MGDDNNFEGETVWDGGSAKTLGEELNGGKEGTIYAIQGNKDAVAKVFTPSKRGAKKDKVHAMLQHKPTDLTLQKKGFPSIIWPKKALYKSRNSSFIGYQMPRLDMSEHIPTARYALNQLDWDDSSKKERYKPAANLATVVNTVHQQNHALGDMNHENILVNDGYIALVDCDSFHITGRDAEYPDTTKDPRYLPVEGRGQHLQIVQRADRFGLAIHIFRLLMEGFHPYAATGSKNTGGSCADMIEHNRFPYHEPDPGVLEPPGGAPDYEKLPSAVQELFKQCFVYGKKQAGARPTAQEWAQTLSEEANLSTDINVNETDTGSDTPTAEQRWGDSDTDTGDGTDTSTDTTGTGTATGSVTSGRDDWRAKATNGSVTSSTGSSADDTTSQPVTTGQKARTDGYHTKRDDNWREKARKLGDSDDNVTDTTSAESSGNGDMSGGTSGGNGGTGDAPRARDGPTASGKMTWDPVLILVVLILVGVGLLLMAI